MLSVSTCKYRFSQKRKRRKRWKMITSTFRHDDISGNKCFIVKICCVALRDRSEAVRTFMHAKRSCNSFFIMRNSKNYIILLSTLSLRCSDMPSSNQGGQSRERDEFFRWHKQSLPQIVVHHPVTTTTSASPTCQWRRCVPSFSVSSAKCKWK